MTVRGPYQQDPETMLVEEFDGQQITDYWSVKERGWTPILPHGCEDGGYEWAHENPDAWEFVSLPTGVDAETALATMANSVAFQERSDLLEAETAEYRRNKVHGKGGKFASNKGGISNEAATDLHAKATAKDGGFTYDVHTGQHATEGYSVSPYPGKTKVIAAKDLQPSHIQAYAKTHEVALAKPGHKLGAWNDNGKVSLDVVIVGKTHAQGEAIGKAHNQKAMYDLKAGKTIQLGGSGGKAYVPVKTVANKKQAKAAAAVFSTVGGKGGGGKTKSPGIGNQQAVGPHLTKKQAKTIAQVMSGFRALPMSNVERSVTRGSTACGKCVANANPQRVPVHPGCHCNINTDNVSVGIPPGDMAALSETFSGAEIKALGKLASSMVFQPETAAVFPLSDFRYGDMAAWLAAVATTELSVRALLSDGDTVVCAAGPETEGSLSEGREAIQDNRRVVMFRADASPEDLVRAYRIICEG